MVRGGALAIERAAVLEKTAVWRQADEKRRCIVGSYCDSIGHLSVAFGSAARNEKDVVHRPPPTQQRRVYSL